MITATRNYLRFLWRCARIAFVGDWRYYASYGYLDGHAEGRTYRNAAEYLAQIHGPIEQTWYGLKFSTVFSEQFAPPPAAP